MYPSLMLAVIMFLSGFLIVSSALKPKAGKEEQRVAALFTAEKLKAVFSLGAMVVAYGIALPFAGFAISSLLFLVAGTRFFGERKWVLAICVQAIFMLFVYVFFIRFLSVNIPFFPSGF